MIWELTLDGRPLSPSVNTSHEYNVMELGWSTPFHYFYKAEF
jgi:hypothetical protein